MAETVTCRCAAASTETWKRAPIATYSTAGGTPAVARLAWRLGARMADFVIYGWLWMFVMVEIDGRLLGGDPFALNARSPLADITATRALVLAVVTSVVYELLPLMLWGASPGKLMMGLRVVGAKDLGRPDALQALVRWASVYAVLLVPYVGFYVSLLVTVPLLVLPDRRGIHDLVAGTVVIERRTAPRNILDEADD